MIGTLSEDKSTIENVEETRLQHFVKYKSLYVAKFPKRMINATNVNHLLPVKVNFNMHQLEIIPTRILYFSRVAKTATRSIMKILMELSTQLGYLVEVPNRNKVIQEDDDEVQKEIGAILKSHRNSVIRCKHYSFINFEKYGVNWNPDWFSMVRNPVDKVRLRGFIIYCQKHEV